MMDKKYLIGAGVSITAGAVLAMGGVFMLGTQKDSDTNSNNNRPAAGEEAVKTYELELMYGEHTYVVEIPIEYELSKEVVENSGQEAVSYYNLVKKGTDEFVAQINIASINRLKEFAVDMNNIKDAITYINTNQCSGEMMFTDLIADGIALVKYIDDTDCWIPTGEGEEEGEVVYYSAQGIGKVIGSDTIFAIGGYADEKGEMDISIQTQQEIAISVRQK